MRFPRLLAALPVAILGIVGTLLPTTPANAQTVSWSVVPADDAGPDGRISLRHESDPGTVVQDAVAVQNLGDEAAEFAVSSGDGVVGSDGAFDVSAPEDSGGWIAVGGLDGNTVRLEPGETRVLPLTITIPPDAIPGDHPAGIVVGRSTTDAAGTLTHRIGVRLHLRVTGDLRPALSAEVLATSFTPSIVPFAPGRLTVDYTVTNSGNTRLGAVPSMTVGGPFGIGTTPAAAETIELLPGAIHTGRIVVDAWPLVVATGEVRMTPTVLGQDPGGLPEPVVAGIRDIALSWSGLGVLLVAGLVLGFCAVRVPRRLPGRRRSPSVHTPASAASRDRLRR